MLPCIMCTFFAQIFEGKIRMRIIHGYNNTVSNVHKNMDVHYTWQNMVNSLVFFIENTECARHCPKCFLYITLFSAQNNDAESGIVFITQKRKLSSEMLLTDKGTQGVVLSKG